MKAMKIPVSLKSITIALMITAFIQCNNKSQSNSDNSADTDTTQNVTTDKILAEFNEKIAADSSNAELYYLRAKYYLRLNKLALAKDDAEKAIKLDSLKPNYYLSLADIYLYSNESRKTNEMLEKCLSLDSKNKQGNFKMAELQFYIKHYDDALNYANAAYDKKNLKANYLIAMILKEKGDTAKAINYLHNCIDIDPNYFEAYDMLGYLEKARNKPIALDYFNSALRIKPESTTSLYGRALCYQNKGDYDNAIKDYTTLIQLNPKMTDAYFNLGYIHQVNLKMYREAIKYYNETLAVDSIFVKALYNKGYCFEQLGDIGNARIEYQHCIEIDPHFEKARSSLKRVMK